MPRPEGEVLPEQQSFVILLALRQARSAVHDVTEEERCRTAEEARNRAHAASGRRRVCLAQLSFDSS